jgi:hypothetical protein
MTNQQQVLIEALDISGARKIVQHFFCNFWLSPHFWWLVREGQIAFIRRLPVLCDLHDDCRHQSQA